jgi:hypothetical protein
MASKDTGRGGGEAGGGSAGFYVGADVEVVCGPAAPGGRGWARWRSGCRWLRNLPGARIEGPCAAEVDVGEVLCQVEVVDADGEGFVGLKEVGRGNRESPALL